MKKLLSVILAIVMLASCAALSLQAFAATDEALSRLDITFTCDPKEGELVGSDYTISLLGTDAQGNTDVDFYEGDVAATTQQQLCAGTGAHPKYVQSYVVITKDDGAIVYPSLREIMYAPKRTRVTEFSDPNASEGNGAVYEAGSKYNYYLLTRILSPYKWGNNTKIYRNGRLCTVYAGDGLPFDTEYRTDHTLVHYLGTRFVTHDVNTVNITFSCNPENGAPIGSDYEIDIDVSADLIEGCPLSVSANQPLTNLPNEFNTYSYNNSLVAIYESDTLLYPGYEGRDIYYAPARKAKAHGSDPTGALGNRGDYTAGTYESGKTYQYYATFRIDDYTWYDVSDNTEFYVNGVKVTNALVQSGRRFEQHESGSNHALCRIQVPVATVTCAHVHDMTYHAAVAATVDAEGNVAYYHCEGCGKNFADEAGTQEIANVVVDKLPNTEPHTDPATEPTTEPAQGDDVCAYCGKVHTGPFAGLTRFFHRIILFFRNIFRR